MNIIYDVILKKIEKDILSYNSQLQAPATDREIKSVKQSSKNILKVNLPEEYLTFLKKCNGLDYNGTVIYATDRKPIVGYDDRYIEGIISANLSARDVEMMKQFLIFGESDDLIHTLDLSKNKYRTIEAIGHSLYAEYDSFDQLLDYVLNEAFNM